MSLGRRSLLAASLPLLAAGTPSPRIACLDYGLAETLLALGGIPAALPDPADYRAWVVRPSLPDGVPDLGLRGQPNLEVLAGLRPDAILAAADHDPIAPLLQRIAPVLRLPIYTAARQPWEQSVEAAHRIAALLGQPAAATALCDGVEARIAAARDALAGRRMRPLLLASLVDARHLVVYGRGSILHAVLDRLGLRNAWAGRTGLWGSVTVGLEELAPFADAALFLVEPVPPGAQAVLAASPLWQALGFVRAGRVGALPPVLMFGTLPAADRFASLLLPRLAIANDA